MRFAALGRTRMLLDGIRACVAAGHEPAFIATAPAAPEYDVREDDFRALAAELGCVFAATLEEGVHADVAISVNWPTLIDPGFLARFPHGVLNGHAGDLPRFRGNACPNWAILQGESHVVATVHEMAEELDAGPIVLQDALPLSDETYVGDVYAWMAATFPRLFAEALTGLESGTITPRPQSGQALRCYPRRPEDGWIDWSQPADRIARLVRASAEPFAGAFSALDGEPITIWRAHAAPLREPSLGVPGQVMAIGAGEVDVLSGGGRLVLETVETASAGRVPAPDAIRSTRSRLGSPPPGTSGTSARSS
jgi:UDP-4-amino-4-deoxy-L-arabinose formyltransferase/UDP-glucuronic acid dehydrogenase (UDP-4-keto-hexauronic acid decarboxylating)